MTEREKKLLMILPVGIVAILIVRFGFLSDSKTAVTPVAGESVAQAEKRLSKLRQIASTVPGKQRILKQVDADLALREKGIIAADTAPQAQARLLEVARKLARAEGFDIRGGDFSQPKKFGADYGEVSATVTFDCRIDQFVNFMAALSHEQELIEPEDMRISSSNPKEKTVLVRMTLGGLVAKKLVPERKGFSSF